MVAAAPVLCSFPTASKLTEALADFVVKAQKEAIEKKGKFTLALSGGSLPKQLSALAKRSGVKWDKWQVFYADERAVPLDDPDSNHLLCTNEFYSKVPIPKENIHTLDPALLDDLEELSDAYEKELIHEFAQKDAARFPVFDLILLGMGPDGHTASLFPGHELLSEEDRWVAYIEDSPKPPPKQDILKTALDKPEEGLPASRVRPAAPGQLYWFVDDAAVAKVNYPKTPFKL